MADRTPRARLELPRSAAPGESLRFVVVNDDDRPLLTGSAYTLERYVDQRWQSVALNRQWFTAEGRIVPPGEQLEMGARLPPDLAPGRYRFGKRVHPRVPSGVAPPASLTAELEVSGAPRGTLRDV